MAAYGFESCLRVTVGTHAEIEIFLQELHSALQASPDSGR